MGCDTRLRVTPQLSVTQFGARARLFRPLQSYNFTPASAASRLAFLGQYLISTLCAVRLIDSFIHGFPVGFWRSSLLAAVGAAFLASGVLQQRFQREISSRFSPTLLTSLLALSRADFFSAKRLLLADATDYRFVCAFHGPPICFPFQCISRLAHGLPVAF